MPKAKKRPVKKAAKKRPAKKAVKKAPARRVVKKSAGAKSAKPVGKVTHYFTEISVAIVRFNKKIPVGATVHFRGATTDFKHVVKSMQYDHKPIAAAPKGKQVGIKVGKRVREGDWVHLAE